MTKHGIPHLQKAGGGSIILVGSVSALAGFTRAQDAYTAAKGALISLNKSLAIQFAKDQIRSNIIHPGIVETPLQAPYLTPELRAEFNDGHTAGTHRPAPGHRLRRAVSRVGGVVLHDGRRDDRRRRLHGPITRSAPWRLPC